jgi:hypothetical protein
MRRMVESRDALRSQRRRGAQSFGFISEAYSGRLFFKAFQALAFKTLNPRKFAAHRLLSCPMFVDIGANVNERQRTLPQPNHCTASKRHGQWINSPKRLCQSP